MKTPTAEIMLGLTRAFLARAVVYTFSNRNVNTSVKRLASSLRIQLRKNSLVYRQDGSVFSVSECCIIRSTSILDRRKNKQIFSRISGMSTQIKLISA